MKKWLRLLALCMALVLALLLCACSSQDDELETDPTEILTPDTAPDDGLGGDTGMTAYYGTSEFAGSYLCVSDGVEWYALNIYDDDSWELFGENATLTGHIEWDADDEAYYAYNDADGSGCMFRKEADGTVYMAAYGYFEPEDGSVPQNEDAGGDGEYVPYEDTGDEVIESPDGDYIDDEFHVAVSSFEGTWYYDGDLAADRFIEINAYGDWYYYGRSAGDAEASEIDCGTLTIAEGETSAYYAASNWYDVTYRVVDFDNGVLVWDEEGTFYRAE